MQSHHVFQAKFIAGVALCLFSATLFAASAKDNQKYEDYKEDTHKALSETRAELDSAVGLYNALLNQETEDAESTYKDLTSAVKKCEKTWAAFSKAADKLDKQAGKMFQSWNKEIEGFGNEQMKELGMQRIAAAQKVYDFLAEKGGMLDGVYRPFITSLNDQVLFMSRDLSPAAMTTLEPVALELNADAEAILAGIDAFLEGKDSEVVAEMVDEAGEMQIDEMQSEESVMPETEEN